MKKNRKKLLLIILVVVLLIAAVAFANIYPMMTMTPAETGKVFASEIYAIKNKINSVYLIKGNDGYMLIDAGTDADGIANSLTELSIDPSEITTIFLTHSDFDHVASLSLFPQAQVFISEDEIQMLDGTTKRNALSRNKLPDTVQFDHFALLTDEQELSLDGYTIKCLKTPGHTPGSMSFLVNDQYLFTGDAVKVTDKKMDIHPFTMDKQMAKASIQQIDALQSQSKYVLTAHYGIYSANELNVAE